MKYLHKNLKEASRMPRYQDYVITDGQLIGDWEGLYNHFDDPWNQSRNDHKKDSRKAAILNWLTLQRENLNLNRVVELGCGFGFFASEIHSAGLSSVGIDISATAIEKARLKNPSCVFIQSALSNFELLSKFDFDVYIMSEITWYVLDDLASFVEWLKLQAKSRGRPIYLVHLLTVYGVGVQKYGTDFFTNLDQVLGWFRLDFIESGFVKTVRADDPESQGTYFIAKVS